jgi:hypothetical protein
MDELTITTKIDNENSIGNSLYDKYKYHCNNYGILYEDNEKEIYDSVGTNITRKNYIILLCGFLCECLRKYELEKNIEFHLIYSHLIDLCNEKIEDIKGDLYRKSYIKCADDSDEKNQELDFIDKEVNIKYYSFLEKLEIIKEKYGL